ncbi:MAG: hypothetical protein Q9201_004248 [Fulgogasparrea decipioides]
MAPGRKSIGPVTTIQGPDYSDADATHRPLKSNYTRANEESFMQKIATKWMQEQGAAQAGRTYSLDKLPKGYELWERPRPSDPSHFDRWLYGHPNHKTFDSPYRFYPHFKYLMQHGSGGMCTCEMCKKSKTSPRSSISAPVAGPKARGRPALQKAPVDEEGTPDICCLLFTLLQNEGRLTRKIEERASLDWRAEKALVDNFVENIPNRPSFLPLPGEIVLYLRPLPSLLQLKQNSKSEHFRIYDPIKNRYTGSPQWLAGIITQVPDSSLDVSHLHPPLSSEPPPALSDAVEGLSGPSINLTGFRIEPLPSPNSPDKNLSKQHTYVPLHLIRPFTFWQTCLQDIPEDSWHPSIHNALTASATVSLIDRHTFKGNWPNADVYSKGIYIGAEAYWVGDTVRLTSSTQPNVQSALVMHIHNIVTSFKNLRAEADGRTVTGDRCDSISIVLQGPVYTLDPLTENHRDVPVEQLTKPMRSYTESWQHSSSQGGNLEAGFCCVFSRLYEEEAMRAWFPATPPAQLIHLGREDTLHARSIAAATDERIVDSSDGTKWFWGGCRAEALDLATVNGLEVGEYDMEREARVWREVLQVLDGRREKVDVVARGQLRMGKRVGEGVLSSSDEDEDEESESESGDVDTGEGEASEAKAENDDMRSPERKKVKVEVAVPLRQ